MIFSIILVCLGGYTGHDAKLALDAKAAAQESVTDVISQWKQSFKALSATESKWNGNFKSSQSINDFIGLYAVLDIGKYNLRSNIDTMALERVEPVTQNNVQIGLNKMCLRTTSAGRDGFEVTAADYDTLFKGLKALAARPDIYIGSISIRSSKTKEPVASMTDFCLLLRDK